MITSSSESLYPVARPGTVGNRNSRSGILIPTGLINSRDRRISLRFKINVL